MQSISKVVNQSNANYDQKKNRCSLEQKTSDGKEYYIGVITDLRGDIQIVVFKNDKKTEKQSDYDILLSEPKEEK